MTHRVAVVIPTHRRPVPLRRALDSIARQTYRHDCLEVIVVASPDDSGSRVVAEAAITSDIPVRCVEIPSDPACGRSPSAKRNYGVQVAGAEWIAFIDDDCEADPRWIEEAACHFDDARVAAVEGRKVIPRTAPPTLTYKGLLQFTKPGGYQTCNIFYRREAFLQRGGFDLAFPFYLEDSDLAWTFLDSGLGIVYADGAVVQHPVPDAAPWLLWEGSKRMILMPYLFKKHPTQYRLSGMRVMRRSHWIYLGLYGLLGGAFAAGCWRLASPLAASVLLFIAAHQVRLFWGCRARVDEVLITCLLTPIVPVTNLVQLWRGNLRWRVWLWT